MSVRRERGSALILMPAVVVVMLILGAIAVDSAIAYLGHRQLEDFTASVADQAAAGALDQGSFYNGGRVRLDPSLVGAIVRQAWSAQNGSGGLTITSVTPSYSPDDRTVTITASGRVHDVFGPAVSSHTVVDLVARSSATVEEVQRAP
jgi:uncharacterized membrane protein